MVGSADLVERSRMVRLCTRLTGDRDAAEDLAQEVLLRAHIHADRLRDPERREAWLAGIARHVCVDWVRSRGRRSAETGWPEGDDLPADIDVEAVLERAEMAALLDRAMGLLPADTRRVLLGRFVDDLPMAEVAGRLGLSEGAVAMRLQRGKAALRRALTTRFREDGADLGLVPPPDGDVWQGTRIWCPGCGARRLRGRYAPERGLHLECPDCTRGAAVCTYIGAHEPVRGVAAAEFFRGIRGFKPALNRLNVHFHALLQSGIAGRCARCRGCGRDAPLRVGGFYGDVETACAHCGLAFGLIGIAGAALATPEARAFQRRHNRIRTLPSREVEAAGVSATIIRFESVTGGDRLDLTYARDGLLLLGAAGTAAWAP